MSCRVGKGTGIFCVEERACAFVSNNESALRSHQLVVVDVALIRMWLLPLPFTEYIDMTVMYSTPLDAAF